MSDQHQPLVSFTVPVYNMERYVGACLDSILSQPFDDYEIVLVDNNSTDRSVAICEEYAAQHERIRYYRLTGEPLYGRAAIHAIDKAQGKYIHYVDSDDLLPSNVYAVIENKLRTDRADVFIGRFNTIIEGSLLGCVDVSDLSDNIDWCEKDQIFKHLGENMPFHMPFWRFIFAAAAWKERMKETVEQVVNASTPLFFGSIYSDSVSTMKLLFIADSIRYLNIPIYTYRIRSSSISRERGSGSKQIIECVKVICSFIWMGEQIAQTEQEQKFVRVYLEMYIYTLATALCTLTSEQLAESVIDVALFLKKYREEFGLSVSQTSLFFSELLREGAEVFLPKYCRYCLSVIERISDDICTKGQNVYLAPSGAIGLLMKTAFELQGVKIAGFFDNDEKKKGVMVDGVTIYSPTAIKAMNNPKPITVLIASRYANVRKDLVEQFKNLGINGKNLIVITF